MVRKLREEEGGNEMEERRGRGGNVGRRECEWDGGGGGGGGRGCWGGERWKEGGRG